MAPVAPLFGGGAANHVIIPPLLYLKHSFRVRFAEATQETRPSEFGKEIKTVPLWKPIKLSN